MRYVVELSFEPPREDRDAGLATVCEACGALVLEADLWRHDYWHDRINGVEED